MAHLGAPLPINDELRLQTLQQLRVLDTDSESAYDDIVTLAAKICETPISLVSLVDRDRQWFKARVGLDTRETHRNMAFCGHAILDPDNLLIVEDAMLDHRFRESPLVLGAPHIRFYAGAPIIAADGAALGTVCVIDTRPRVLTESQTDALRALARQASTMLHLRALCLDEQAQTQTLRQKIADALGGETNGHAAIRQSQRVASAAQLTTGMAHDLNNLLQSVSVNLEIVQRRAKDPEQVMRWSGAALQTIKRGANLIAQILAFSRNKVVEPKPVSVGAHIAGMQELLSSAVGRRISVSYQLHDGDAEVLCDETQLEAAVLNLVINARDAMAGAGNIQVTTGLRRAEPHGTDPGGQFVDVAVIDDGPGMSADVAARAFDPFFSTKNIGVGTGLGLAQVYAFAHRGGGTAAITTAAGGGTTVRFSLRAS